MEIKDYVKQFRDLQKSHKKVRVADFCRENMLDYYELVDALKQEKLETESYEEQVQCGDLVITEIPEPNVTNQVNSPSESYIKAVMLSFPKGVKLTVREITPSDLITIVQRLMPYYSRLKMQTEAQENKIQEKDSEVLRLLNQIATDMIRKSDVDRLVEEAVAKATAALKADYEERMKAMAAEYEAKIAELQNQKDGKGDDKDQTPGKSTKNSKKKGSTV